MYSRHPIRISLRLAALAAFFLSAHAWADTVKPLFSGPFFMNELNFSGSPAGYEYVLSNGFYHFQVGWIEPLAEGSKGIFGETYFETDGNFNVSPFTSDLGTTFNVKPIRYLEFGLSYNRLLFHNTMVTFVQPGESLPDKSQYAPDQILSYDGDVGGADIFTFLANFTLDMGRTQLYLSASRALWDIDAKGKDYIYEYGIETLIRTRDRVNDLSGQLSLDLRPWSLFKSVSLTGLALRDEYTITTQTEIEKNLVSFGITGFRLGRNPEQQRRGLDLSIGYWTLHDQIPRHEPAKSIVILADWKWNIHFLKM